MVHISCRKLKSYHFVGVVVFSLVDRDKERNEKERINKKLKLKLDVHNPDGLSA